MLTAFMTQTATVQKLTTSQNAMGGISRSYTTRINSLPCRLSKRLLKEADQYGKVSYVQSYTMYCEATGDALQIERSDKVVVDGKTYEVTDIYNPGGLNKHLEIGLELVE